jgi:hypothetical protein
VPTLAEICLKLSETEVQQGNLSGSVSTLTEALAIEKSQYVMNKSHPADSLIMKHQNWTSTPCSITQQRVLGSAEE